MVYRTANEIRDTIRERIKAARVSQSAYATSIGISKQYLSDVLNAKTEDIPAVVLQALGFRRVVRFVVEGRGSE